MNRAERIARAFHEVYEAEAEVWGWSTQDSSRVPWDDLPAANKTTMVSTVGLLLVRGVIAEGPGPA